VRVHLKGIKRTSKRLADGSEATYFYAWRGGPRLPGQPGDSEFVAAYNEAIAGKRPKSGETLASILDAYQDSQALCGLSERSQKDYKIHLRSIGREFGTFPIEALADRAARGEFLQWRDRLAKVSPRGADYLFSVFARALSWALDRRLVPVNPLGKRGRVWRGNRNDRVWGDVEEANMRAACGPALRLALAVAVWTGQRQGDILRLTWAAYNGDVLRIRQGKTGKEVLVPASSMLKAELAATARTGLYIVSHEGRPFTTDGFKTSWGRATERAGAKGLTFHDLRGTFATRCYECGATDAEVASVTGHGADGQAHATLRRHYLHANLVLARECIRKLETRTTLATGVATVRER
jgi:integrase